MAGKLNIFNFGDLGVDLVKSPIHLPDGAWTLGQNAEFILQGGQGGIKKRGGMAKLNTSTLAGTVQVIETAPFPYPGTTDLMVGLNSGETNNWKKSPDGSAYTDITSAVLQRLAASFTSLWGTATIPRDPRAVAFNGKMYFVGDDYVVDTSSPPIVVFNGTAQAELLRVPTNPTSAGAVPRWIAEFFTADDLIYFGVYDAGGIAPDHKGRVLQLDPTNGTLEQIGNRFGNGSGENTAGFPFCLTKYLGQLYAGTYGVSGNNRGKVYRIQPGVDETWTMDHQATLHNGYYMSLCAYNGKLYAATDADSSGTACIEQRTSLGVWSSVLSAPAGNTAFFSSMIVFNNLLFAGYYNPNATASTLIKKYDGSSWSTDKDVGVDVAALVPGKPCVFRGDLYWPFYDLTSDGTKTGFVLKRTTGGVWTSVLSSVGLRGGLCQYIPAS